MSEFDLKAENHPCLKVESQNLVEAVQYVIFKFENYKECENLA